MSKIYEKKTVEYIQSCLDSGNVVIESFDSYENILPNMSISLGEVTVHFYKQEPTNPKVPGYSSSQYLGESADREYIKVWNTLPVKSHMVKDFKYLNTDKDDNVPYKTFTYTDKDGSSKRALVRFLYEIEDMDADQPECLEYYFTYTDLVFNDCCYMIVKIENSASENYQSKFSLRICDMVHGDMLDLPEMPGKSVKKGESASLF